MADQPGRKRHLQHIVQLIKKNGGIKLDMGCGFNKQPGYVGMDKRRVDGVDIVHDLEDVPYPLPDECCVTILASHIMEHLDPRKFINIMDELWRVMKPHGQLLISTPYAGTPGFWQDPTHIHAYNEATWTYFEPGRALYEVYRPKPWKIERNAWHASGNMEVILSAKKEQGQRVHESAAQRKNKKHK